MRKQYTESQKSELKKLRKRLAELRKYVPMGQGDGFNRDRGVSQVCWNIDQIKENRGNQDNPFGKYTPSKY